MSTPLPKRGSDSRHRRFLDMGGLSLEFPGLSAREEEERIAEMSSWLPIARERLALLELRRAPWRHRSPAGRLLRLAATVVFWAAGLVLTYSWSLLAFVPFAAFFALCSLGTWLESRRIDYLRMAIDEAERFLAQCKRSGHEIPQEPPADH